MLFLEMPWFIHLLRILWTANETNDSGRIPLHGFLHGLYRAYWVSALSLGWAVYDGHLETEVTQLKVQGDQETVHSTKANTLAC